MTAKLHVNIKLNTFLGKSKTCYNRFYWEEKRALGIYYKLNIIPSQKQGIFFHSLEKIVCSETYPSSDQPFYELEIVPREQDE